MINPNIAQQRKPTEQEFIKQYYIPTRITCRVKLPPQKPNQRRSINPTKASKRRRYLEGSEEQSKRQIDVLPVLLLNDSLLNEVSMDQAIPVRKTCRAPKPLYKSSSKFAYVPDFLLSNVMSVDSLGRLLKVAKSKSLDSRIMCSNKTNSEHK